MNTGLEYNLALRVRDATRWAEKQQGLLPPDEVFVPPSVGNELKRIDITAGSFIGSWFPPTLIPARGKIRGTEVNVWVIGEGGKTLTKPYSNDLTVTLAAAIGTYTFNGVTLPYYQAFRHDADLQVGKANSGRIGKSGNELPIYQDSPFFPYYYPGPRQSVAKWSGSGDCLFSHYGDYGILHSFLTPRWMLEITAQKMSGGYDWSVNWYGLFTVKLGQPKLLSRGTSKDTFIVTLAFLETDFNLDLPILINACLSSYYPSPYTSLAHDPFQVADPNASSTLGAPLGAPLGG